MALRKTLAQIEKEQIDRAIARGMSPEQANRELGEEVKPKRGRPPKAKQQEQDFDDADFDDDDNDGEDYEDYQDRDSLNKPNGRFDADDSDDDADDDYDDRGEDADENDGDEDPKLVQLRQELTKLQHDYNALQGRVTPDQKRMEEFKTLYHQEHNERERERNELNRELENLRAQLQERESEFELSDIFSEEELEMRDTEELEMIKRLTKEAVKRYSPKVNVRDEIEQYRKEVSRQDLDQYRNELLTDPRRNLVQLRQLANDPKFIEWSSKKENAGFDGQVMLLLNASSKTDVDIYAREVEERIAEFRNGASRKRKSRSTDANTNPSLDRSMRRRPQKLSNADIAAKLDEARRLSRGSRADRAKAKAIINKYGQHLI